MTVLPLKMGRTETLAVEDKTCLVELHPDGTATLDLHAHPVVTHASNVVRRAIRLESVQMLQVTLDLHAHPVVTHASNVVRRVIRLESVQMLQVTQDLPVHLGVVHVSNAAKRDIKREIVQMQTSVVRVEIRESVEASIGMVIAGATVEVVATTGEAIEEGTV